MAQLQLSNLALVVFLTILSECVENEVSLEIKATTAEDTILRCNPPNPGFPAGCRRARWIKVTSEIPDFVGETLSMTENLTLKAMKKNQEGVYRCEVCERWNCVWTTKIFLKLRECKVLERVKATPNTTATLPCPFYTTNDNITWSEVKGDTTISILQYPSPSTESSLRGAVKTTSLNGERWFGNLTVGDGSLFISSTEVGDRWYRCTVTSGQRNRCSDVMLQVKAEADNPPITSTFSTLTTQWTEEPATTSTESLESLQTEYTSLVVKPVVLILTGIAAFALIVGLYCKQRTRNTAGVSLWEDHQNDNIHPYSVTVANSEYGHIQADPDENLCTFIYE